MFPDVNEVIVSMYSEAVSVMFCTEIVVPRVVLVPVWETEISDTCNVAPEMMGDAENHSVRLTGGTIEMAAASVG